MFFVVCGVMERHGDGSSDWNEQTANGALKQPPALGLLPVFHTGCEAPGATKLIDYAEITNEEERAGEEGGKNLDFPWATAGGEPVPPLYSIWRRPARNPSVGPEFHQAYDWLWSAQAWVSPRALSATSG